ncbi:MAG: hypothetical protein EOP07_13070 [Proteobacteria bacterium]|nr:MAG: hypothetical protein EOP07_13070 [Pseudomonadota bacterium]
MPRSVAHLAGGIPISNFANFKLFDFKALIVINARFSGSENFRKLLYQGIFMNSLKLGLVFGLSVSSLFTASSLFAMPGDTIRAHIVNRNSGKVLDEDIGSHRVQQWKNFSSLNQTWTFFEYEGGSYDVINNQTGNCLEVNSDNAASSTNGLALRASPCNGTPAQRFTLEAVLVGNPGGISGSDGYRIRSVNSGKCVDVENHSKKNGSKIQQWDCHDALNQRWDIIDVPQ